MLVVLHSGQSGVERGAQQGAVAAGFTIAGVMRHEQRDEYGRLPENVARDLGVCTARGARAAARETLSGAHGLVLLCPDVASVTGDGLVYWIVRTARRSGLPCLVIGANDAARRVSPWLDLVARAIGVLPRIYITGPRASRWPQGEGVARRLVVTLAGIDTVA